MFDNGELEDKFLVFFVWMSSIIFSIGGKDFLLVNYSLKFLFFVLEEKKFRYKIIFIFLGIEKGSKKKEKEWLEIFFLFDFEYIIYVGFDVVIGEFIGMLE